MSIRKEQLSDHTLKTATWKGANDESECPEGNGRQTGRFHAKETMPPRLLRSCGSKRSLSCLDDLERIRVSDKGRIRVGMRQMLTQGGIFRRGMGGGKN